VRKVKIQLRKNAMVARMRRLGMLFPLVSKRLKKYLEKRGTRTLASGETTDLCEEILNVAP
jgi:hypothetical protein